MARRMEMEQEAEKEEKQGRVSARASKPGIAPGEVGLRARLAGAGGPSGFLLRCFTGLTGGPGNKIDAYERIIHPQIRYAAE